MMNDKKTLKLSDITTNKSDGNETSTTADVSTEAILVSTDDIRNTIVDNGGTLHEGEIVYDDIVDHYCNTIGLEAAKELREKAQEIVKAEIEAGTYDEVFNLKEGGDVINDETSNNDKPYVNSYIDDKDDKAPSIDEVDEESYDEGDDNESYVDVNNEEMYKILKNKIKEKLSPITKPINLETFTVSSKPKGLLDAITQSKDVNVNVADWVMYESKFGLSMSELDGAEIEKLDPNNSRRSMKNATEDAYKILYNHLTNKDLPDFETFFKTLKFKDLDHLYFLAYRASFDNKNLLSLQCNDSKCNEIFVENIDMRDMVKYKNDKVKNGFNSILEATNPVFTADEIAVERVQISDTYVVDFKEPSIYNMTIELLSLPESFRKKYGELLGMLLYIDSIYFINHETNSLEPIRYKIEPKDLMKTMQNKILAYKQVTDSLSSDHYSFLGGIVGRLSNHLEEPDVSYRIPSKKCPKCGKMTDEIEESPFNLLFTRHRLVAILNM